MIPPFRTTSLEEAVASLSPPSLSFEGTTSNILTSTGPGVVSGRGAGHLISFAFAIHSYLKDNSFRGNFMINIRIASPGTRLLT